MLGVGLVISVSAFHVVGRRFIRSNQKNNHTNYLSV